MRPAPIAALAAMLTAVCVLAPATRANDDRLDVHAWWARGAERFHALAADTLGLSFGSSYTGGAGVDFRVVDVPMKAARKPSLHVTGGISTDERTLGPARPGQTLGRFAVFDLRSGVR